MFHRKRWGVWVKSGLPKQAKQVALHLDMTVGELLEHLIEDRYTALFVVSNASESAED